MCAREVTPVVIAHRGASGYLPEHSLAAKALAAGQGADFLEQDVVASRDGALLVLHDLNLDFVSDVARKFPGRAREDGHFYCIDFDLDEIRSLAFHERRTPEGKLRYPQRYPPDAPPVQVHTLAEELGFIAGLSHAIGRPIGIYPEIKAPSWHRDQGIDLTASVIDELARFGYPGNQQPVFLQCFEAAELVRVRAELGDALPLIQLMSSQTVVDAALLDDVSRYAAGIGPSLRLLLNRHAAAGRPQPTALVRDAQDRGLLVHPYTFRRDELPDGVADFDELLNLCVGRLRVDGVFTDFPDLVRRWLDRRGKSA